MKYLLRFWLLMVFFLSSNFLYAQWIQTSGPQSENITALAVTGENIFAGTKYSGIFLSTNNGENWTHLDNGLAGVGITGFAQIGTNLFVGTEGGGVFLSTDGGLSGVAVNEGLGNFFIASLAVSGNKLFANTRGGLFVSSDNGAHWTSISQLNNLSGGPLLVNQNSDGSTSIYVGDYTGLYRSTNDGSDWIKLNNPPTDDSNPYVTALIAMPNNSGGNYLFVGTWGDGVFRTSDDGANWKKCNTGLTQNWWDDVYVNTFAVIGATLLIGENLQSDFECGVFRSTDYGATWSSTNLELKNSDVVALAVKDMNLFAGTSDAGVFRSTNNGINWTQVNKGMSYQYANAFAIKGTNLYAGCGNGGVFLSTDKGDSWTQLNNNTNVFPITAITIPNNNSIIISTTQDNYRSTDNGLTWSNIQYIKKDGSIYSSGIPSCVWSLINIPRGADSSYIFAGSSNEGIVRSIDNGDWWNPVNAGLWADTRNYIVYALVAAPNASGGTNLYAGMGHQGLAYYGAVYVSKNYGSSWTDISNGLPNAAVWSLAISGANLFAGTNDSGIYRSSIDGAGWTAVNEGLTSKIVSAITVNGNRIFAGTYDGGIFQSTNNGDTWSPINEDLTNLSINALITDDINLYAGTVEGGVWKRSLSEIAAVEPAMVEKPTQFLLAQNYPNPFNPRTTIRFSFPEAGHVSLNVYNNMGQKVAELVSQEMGAGSYNVEWNASGFASGMYFYRLEANNFVATKKLILLR